MVEYSLMDFAVPFVMRAKATEGHLLMPLLHSDDPQDASFAMSIADMTVNPEVWALVDPGTALPRDPLQIAMDMTGQLMINDELLDILPLIERAEFGDLIQPVSVQLNSMLLKGLGTEMTGQGAFTFDVTDMVTIPGVPRPEGKLTLKATGVNALLDLLESAGIAAPEELMGVRMGIGMIAKPAEGEDLLISEFEFNSEGHFMANGLRLK